MIYLRPDFLETVKQILAAYVPEYEVRLFGSRYQGTHTAGSDLDLALVGPERLHWQTMARLTAALEESNLPFRVDVLDWHTISPEFQRVIEQGYEVIQKQRPGAGSTVWQKVRLDQISQVICGATPSTSVPEYWADEIKWVTAKDVSESTGYKIYDTERKISRLGFDNCSTRMIPKESTVLIARGATMGRSCLLGEDMAINQTCYALVPNREKVDPYFLFYSIKLLDSFFQKIAHGAIFNTVIGSGLRETEIDLPDLHTQRRIAGILSALDEKIELNRQTNATLEAIAQAIFKEWFVNFNYPGATRELVESDLGLIPAGWRVGKLTNVCRNKRLTVHPNDVLSETPYVGLEHIPRKSLGLTSWGIADDVGSQKTHFQKFDILFGKLRPYFHKVCIAPFDGICSTDILVIEPLKNDFFSLCLNHLFSNEMITYVSAIADGTRMPRVDWNSIGNYEIVLPPESLLAQFNEVIFAFYDEIIENNRQSDSLAQIRDVLLPKLMRGEVVV